MTRIIFHTALAVAIIILGSVSASDKKYNIDYSEFERLANHKYIDLGTFVGKHQLPADIVRVTKTLAIKVPVAYPVKIPHSVPYPVPVQITKIIKVPVETHHQHGEHESAGSYTNENYHGHEESGILGQESHGQFAPASYQSTNSGEHNEQPANYNNYQTYNQGSTGSGHEHQSEASNGSPMSHYAMSDGPQEHQQQQQYQQQEQQEYQQQQQQEQPQYHQQQQQQSYH